MTEIPDDIMQAALGLRVLIGQKKHDRDLTATIARALMAERLAERERCALIADARADAYAEIANKHDGTPIGESNTMRCGAAAAIATAIRGQS